MYSICFCRISPHHRVITPKETHSLFKTSYHGGASARIRMIGKRGGKISYSSIDPIFKG